MPDPDDILPEQYDFIPSDEPPSPAETPAPTAAVGQPSPQTFDVMNDMAQVAAGEVDQPVTDTDMPVMRMPGAPPTGFPPGQSPQERVAQAAWERGAERKARLGEPIPPPPDTRTGDRISDANAAFIDIGQVARMEATDVDSPASETNQPGLGGEFAPESFANQGFDVQQMALEGQQRDAQRQMFDAGVKLNVVLTEMTKEYGRKLDDLATRLERDRL